MVWLGFGAPFAACCGEHDGRRSLDSISLGTGMFRVCVVSTLCFPDLRHWREEGIQSRNRMRMMIDSPLLILASCRGEHDGRRSLDSISLGTGAHGVQT